MDWLVGLIAAAIAIYAMVDLSLKNHTLKVRMIWFPIVILIPIVGPLVYYGMRNQLLNQD